MDPEVAGSKPVTHPNRFFPQLLDNSLVLKMRAGGSRLAGCAKSAVSLSENRALLPKEKWSSALCHVPRSL